MAVVVAMHCRPPENALLGGGLGQEGQKELAGAAGMEGAVAEVAVVPRGHAEHPDPIEGQAQGSQSPGARYPEGPQTGQVQGNKSHNGRGQGEPSGGHGHTKGNGFLHCSFTHTVGR